MMERAIFSRVYELLDSIIFICINFYKLKKIYWTCLYGMVVWTWAVSRVNLPYEETEDSLANFCFWKDCSNRSQGNNFIYNLLLLILPSKSMVHSILYTFFVLSGERGDLSSLWANIPCAHWVQEKSTMVWAWIYFIVICHLCRLL